MIIREAQPKDHDSIWEIFRAVVSTGETYAFPRNMTREEGLAAWLEKPLATYVLEETGIVVGTYYLKANQMGPGAHVCNCGYMVSESARGRGFATAMCEHSQIEARRRGFQAMQFNLVLASNKGAVKLWRKLEFDIVGTLPKAFDHPRLGLTDAHIMYKWLER